ncbi:MAG: MaoC family dehydratase, partial [Verrucomicrobiota bacterium]
MKILAERDFTLADQSGFAALSGDFNPLHMDELAARRTVFGTPVVHGVHLVLWALESWLGTCREAMALESLSVSFKGGTWVGDTVSVIALSDAAGLHLRIQPGQTELVSIRGKLGPPVVYPETLPGLEPVECRAMDAADIPDAAGSLPLSYCA